MTNRNIVLAVIIVIIIALIVWIAMRHKAQAPVEMNESPAATTTLPSGTSTSDAALDEDISGIGAQMQGLDNDSANADASLNESAQPQ